MGVAYAIFRSAGKVSQHVIPGGYSRIDTPQGRLGNVSMGNGVIVGECTGGKPNSVMWFSKINDAIRTLRSGPLLDAIRFALNPGGDLIPQKIAAVRVNSAVRSSGVLKDAASDDVIDIKSKDYGIYTNGIKVDIENATTKGKKLTVTLNQDSKIVDDIYKDSIKIQYTGDASTGIMSISGTQLTTTLAGDQTDGSLDLVVLFSTYDTIEKVVGYINSQIGYSCSLVVGVDENDASNELDAYIDENIKASEVTVTSNVQAMIDAINNQSEYLYSAALHTAAVRDQIVNISNYYLSGGSEGTAGNTEHTNTLTMLRQENMQVVGTSDDTYSIHALYKTHVQSMNSATGKRERQLILGALCGDTLSNVITQAKIINEKAVGFCYGEFKDYDLNGVKQQYGSVYYAAKMIGQFCALDIIQPHTFKEFDAIELVSELEDTEKEQAILNGVWVPGTSPQGTFRTVRSITTYQKDNLIYNEFSMVRTALYASRDFRNYMEKLFVGKAGDTTVLVSMKTMATVRLNSHRNDLDLFVDNPKWGGTSWKDLVFTINGDKIQVDYDATITSPINFMFSTSSFSVLISI